MSDADTNESLGFDFAPDWARKSAEEYVSRYQGKTYDERTGREARPPREGGFRDRERMGNRREGERSRPPRRDFGEGERRPRRDRDGNRPRREGDAPRMEGDRPRPPRRNDRPFVRREPIKPVEAELRILPNQRNLGIIIRTLQGTHTAYPVKKFVNMFLENPQACLARFEAKADSDVLFWTCKRCEFIALSEAEVVAHVMAEHLKDFFDISQEACEAPSGTFPCVAKCTITGEWVGAPNHHSYKRRVAELAARTGMPERDYLRTLEMCRDAESVEAWKQTETTRTVYRLKAQEADAATAAASAAEGEGTEADAPAEDTRTVYNHDQAEALFRRDILPGLVTSAKHVCVPLPAAQASTSQPLALKVKYTLRDEQRYPRTLFFALRGAFRHRKFTLFRANDERGPEFVANMTPTPFTAEHVVRELAEAIKYVTEHPLCTRVELMTALREALSDMDINVVARQIAFLFSKGHIVEYYNGVLALPETNPRFRKLPEEMKREREAAGVEAAPAQEAAAAPGAEAEPLAETAVQPTPETLVQTADAGEASAQGTEEPLVASEEASVQTAEASAPDAAPAAPEEATSAAGTEQS